METVVYGQYGFFPQKVVQIPIAGIYSGRIEMSM